ncbi:hypothetical protein C1K40_004445 [Salmonella enterica]|nr:hypothetical protein [Salmonella enterica]
MANTNPLDALNIKKLVGFKQITPGVITGNVVTALKQCGVDIITDYNGTSSEASIGHMTVLGNTFYGLKLVTEKNKTAPYFSVPLVSDIAMLKEKPVQAGFRLTQSAVSQRLLNADMVSFINHYPVRLTSRITPGTEDTSVYYEIVLSATKNISNSDVFIVDVYVNKQKISTANALFSGGADLHVQFGTNLTPDTDAGFSYMVGDLYIAELDYNSDGTVTPQLLGNLTLEPFTVASYTGDKHTNTKNQDIVTALNTLDPNNDLGVLAIKPVEQAASVTFNAPDIAGKSIYGASLNIVYKDSVAPNNRLSYQITEGTTQLPTEIITTRNADVTGFTTFSKILTTPANGGDWNEENLKFKLDMFNRGTE